MGFKTGDFPPVDPETWPDVPFNDKVRILSTQWAEFGFGTPKVVHVIYIVKVSVLYVLGGVLVATLTSGLSPIEVSAWWSEPIVYTKFILWTVLLESIGLAGSWGPMAAHFKPMTGGILYWARVDTIRMPPWARTVPFTKGNRRTIGDVILYLAILAGLVVALVLPSTSDAELDRLSPDNAGMVKAAGLLFLPVLGNLRPDLVSFLPSMRQYAGNWASATWAFAPGAEKKLDRLTRPAGNTIDQLAHSYPPPVAEVLLNMTLGWRALHSQGPALFSMIMKHTGADFERYTLREAEFCCNTVVGFNFGDGHFHNADLIAAIQERCAFEPGELIVAWVESQPIHKDHQRYQVIDAALGVIERGTYRTKDSISQQPWMPDGPIPLEVTWERPTIARDLAVTA